MRPANEPITLQSFSLSGNTENYNGTLVGNTYTPSNIIYTTAPLETPISNNNTTNNNNGSNQTLFPAIDNYISSQTPPILGTTAAQNLGIQTSSTPTSNLGSSTSPTTETTSTQKTNFLDNLKNLENWKKGLILVVVAAGSYYGYKKLKN